MTKPKPKKAQPAEKCGTCAAYRMSDGDPTQGTCHLDPPQGAIAPASASQLGAQWIHAWPTVREDDWCQQWNA